MTRNRKITTLFVAGMLSACIVGCFQSPTNETQQKVAQPLDTLMSLEALLKSPRALARVDIACMNLLCTEGLPGIENFDQEECLRRLDDWARHARIETERHWYRFRKNPAEYEHSEGFFRVLMMAVVLTEDFRVNYAPLRRVDPSMSSMDDGFFSNASDVFLLGLLGPKRQGTCSSLPVLYVAIGRRLGYPLKLATTKGHLFVRRGAKEERIKVEGHGESISRFEGEYYREWPIEVNKEEEEAEGYLRSLTPEGELAAFLSMRGMCLREAGRR